MAQEKPYLTASARLALRFEFSNSQSCLSPFCNLRSTSVGASPPWTQRNLPLAGHASLLALSIDNYTKSMSRPNFSLGLSLESTSPRIKVMNRQKDLALSQFFYPQNTIKGDSALTSNTYQPPSLTISFRGKIFHHLLFGYF